VVDSWSKDSTCAGSYRGVPCMSRIAKEIGLYRGLDELGRQNYLNSIFREFGEYSSRYNPVNARMAKVTKTPIVLDDSDVAYKYLKDVEDMKATNCAGCAGWSMETGKPLVMIAGDTSPIIKPRVVNHELAHIGLLHRKNPRMPKAIAEIEAEGTTYGVGHMLGIPNDVLIKPTVLALNNPTRSMTVEQIGNAIEERKPIVSDMVKKFMKGLDPYEHSMFDPYD